MRDAISLFDLCISHGGAVTAEVVAQAAGMAGSGHLLTLAKALLKGYCFCFGAIGALHEKSMDMDRLCSDLVAFHRDLMILKTVEKPERFIVALPEEMEEMKPLAQFLTLSQILYAFCFAGGAESYVHCKPAHRAGNVRCPYLQSGDGQLR